MSELNQETDDAVYKLQVDCGRQGELTGLFIAPKEHVKRLVDDKIDVYFGEVLGKHSEIFGCIEERDIQFISEDPSVIKIIRDFNLEFGHNPFDYTTTNAEDGEEDLTVGEIIQKRISNEKSH